MSWAGVAAALQGVRYKDWRMRIDSEPDGRVFIQWLFVGRCVKSGELCEQRGRKWHLSEHMTVSEVVGTAFKAALTAEEHECRENFTWRGKRVFGPHIDVELLHQICHVEDVRDDPPAA